MIGIGVNVCESWEVEMELGKFFISDMSILMFLGIWKC